MGTGQKGDSTCQLAPFISLDARYFKEVAWGGLVAAVVGTRRKLLERGAGARPFLPVCARATEGRRLHGVRPRSGPKVRNREGCAPPPTRWISNRSIGEIFDYISASHTAPASNAFNLTRCPAGRSNHLLRLAWRAESVTHVPLEPRVIVQAAPEMGWPFPDSVICCPNLRNPACRTERSGWIKGPRTPPRPRPDRPPETEPASWPREVGWLPRTGMRRLSARGGGRTS